MAPASTWIIVGASRGIGLEFVRQLLAQGHKVIAGVRNPFKAQQLDELVATHPNEGNCRIEECDMLSEESIITFTRKITIDPTTTNEITIILNAGINEYPNRVAEISYASFTQHLQTNTIGPLICAQHFLRVMPTTVKPVKIVFISSDSGSTQLFRAQEDGFGVYAATKAALNQGLRHLAAELEREESRIKEGTRTCILAMHPGEVETDMANVDLPWEIEGSIQVDESVRGMLEVIQAKHQKDTGTFWCWDGRAHPW
ncbi:NAD(P)-binding protein [Aspergillus homomorphus CBS 101889]|uniref:NAD(P)-binding protein n=1 Tax=Aspergillus homomorphus (strain CBS 101889) TaxID=1450537 RepID=A0A395HUA2_ASPHC|nr:NAD(P)-binding protein [Aspergillus homomorphus CBS 101889]RAL11512.1 NAD(P)-binding protein [Aspergillus homomorphus CBS 101889]